MSNVGCGRRSSRTLRPFSPLALKAASAVILLASLPICACTAEMTGGHTTEQVVVTDTPVRNAHCLDGSPPLYYVSRGRQGSKWLLWLQGGDWCERIARVQIKGERVEWSCTRRSEKLLGSSQHEDKANERLGSYPTNLTHFGNVYGFFSREPSRNVMHDWNHVMLRYCDGGSFSGTTTLPSENGDLYLQGKAVLQALILDLLRNQGMAGADTIVLSGSSAGGLAVMMQGEDIHSMIAQEAQAAGRAAPRLALLVEGGFFPMHQANYCKCQYRKRMEAFYKLHRPDSVVLRRCVTANHDTPWRCVFGVHLVPHIRLPMFASLSVHDSWSIPHVLCSVDAEELTQYGRAFRREVTQAFEESGLPHGLFIDSCRHHTKCWNLEVGSVSTNAAFSKWMSSDPQQKMAWVDEAEYGNLRCEQFYEETSCPVGVNLTAPSLEPYVTPTVCS